MNLNNKQKLFRRKSSLETKFLNQEQEDLVVGSLLGDGNLQTSTPEGKTWRYRALQKKDQKSYLDHKYEILKSLCGSPPIFSDVFDSRTQKSYQRYYFNTLTHEGFHPYGHAFSQFDPEQGKWKKGVPANIHEILTPRAVAYWYMDDGSLKYLGKSNAMRICTESFSTEENEILRNAMFQNFNISLGRVKKTNSKRVFVGYRLTIHEKESSKFRELIQPFLVQCMK